MPELHRRIGLRPRLRALPELQCRLVGETDRPRPAQIGDLIDIDLVFGQPHLQSLLGLGHHAVDIVAHPEEEVFVCRRAQLPAVHSP